LNTVKNPPANLDINPWNCNPELENMPHYSLKSIIRHIENPASGGNFRKCKLSRGNIVSKLNFSGHYVSYITDRNGQNKWSCFDDSNVSLVKNNIVNDDPLQQTVVFVYVRDDINDH